MICRLFQQLLLSFSFVRCLFRIQSKYPKYHVSWFACSMPRALPRLVSSCLVSRSSLDEGYPDRLFSACCHFVCASLPPSQACTVQYVLILLKILKGRSARPSPLHVRPVKALTQPQIIINPNQAIRLQTLHQLGLLAVI